MVFKLENAALFSGREKRKSLTRRSREVIHPRASREPEVRDMLLHTPSHISESHCFPTSALDSIVEILAFCNVLLLVLIHHTHTHTSTAVKVSVS